MKNGIIYFAFVLLFAGCASDKAAMKEALNTMTPGTPDRIAVKVPNVERKTVIDNWEDFVEKYDAKTYTVGSEVYADNAVIPAVQDGTLDIYTVFSEIENETGTFMNVTVDLGGALLSSGTHPEKYKAVQNLIDQFVKQTAGGAVRSKFENVTKSIRKHEKERESLVKENNELKKEIDKNKQEISENEKEISKLDAKLKEEMEEAVRLKEEEKKIEKQ
ncbi:MAG: hypothetical protein WD077_13900 [Bacteroidia bacterium]